MRIISNFEVKVEDHITSQITLFKYLGSIVQNDGKIEADVNCWIQVDLLKYLGSI
jgi:hypothetical protein